MQRLPMIYGHPTRAALVRATSINPKTGLPETRNPAPRWIGHGQQLAAKRLGYDPTAPEPDARWTKQMPASAAGARPRKSRGPTGFDFSKCDPLRHLNSSIGKRQWRAKISAKRRAS